jgi:hypothetical protein
MNKIMTTCFAAVAFCGAATAALASPTPSQAQTPDPRNTQQAMTVIPAPLAQPQYQVPNVVGNYNAPPAPTLPGQSIVQSGPTAQKFPASVGG